MMIIVYQVIPPLPCLVPGSGVFVVGAYASLEARFERQDSMPGFEPRAL